MQDNDMAAIVPPGTATKTKVEVRGAMCETGWHPVLVARFYGPDWAMGRRLLVMEGNAVRVAGWRLRQERVDMGRRPFHQRRPWAETLFRAGRPFGVCTRGYGVSSTCHPEHLYVLTEVVEAPPGEFLTDYELSVVSPCYRIAWGRKGRWRRAWMLDNVTSFKLPYAYEVYMDRLAPEPDRTYTIRGSVARVWDVDVDCPDDIRIPGGFRTLGSVAMDTEKFIGWTERTGQWALLCGYIHQGPDDPYGWKIVHVEQAMPENL